MRLFRAASRTPVPWRNGAGKTEAVAVDTTRDRPGWRVSIATLERDAPFSSFDGYARTLRVIEGGPIALDAPGWHHLLGLDDEVAFGGEEAVSVRVAAAARVLNVMTDRTRFTHDLLATYAPADVEDGMLVVALSNSLLADGVALRRLDAVGGPCRIEGSDRFLSIRLAAQ